MNKTFFIISVIKYATGIIELLLILRIILKSLGASAKAVIVKILYGTTDFLAYPFQGIFPPVYTAVGGVLDLAAISAAIGYFILALVIIKLIHLLFVEE